MALTKTQETAAITLLDANVTKTPVKVDDKYVFVPHVIKGIHTAYMHEYVTPAKTVGYIRYVWRPDPVDPDIIHLYTDHQGPNTNNKNGWSSSRLWEKP